MQTADFPLLGASGKQVLFGLIGGKVCTTVCLDNGPVIVLTVSSQ